MQQEQAGLGTGSAEQCVPGFHVTQPWGAAAGLLEVRAIEGYLLGLSVSVVAIMLSIALSES